jgi:peptidoglycan/LPS O-acetylase OafA/YrhL
LITYVPPKYRIPLHFMIIFAALFFDYSQISYRFFNPMINEIKRCYGQIVELIKYASLGILFGILFKENKNKFILFLLAGLSLLLLIIYKFPAPHGFNYSGIKLFFGTILILSSTLLITNINFSPKINNFINILGGYSFGVYLFHIIFYIKLFQVFPDLKHINNQYPLVVLFVYIISCYAFCFLFDRLTLKKFSFLVK